MTANVFTIWLIDDSESNHEAAHNTVASMPWVTLRSFYSGADAVTEFSSIEENAEMKQTAPNAVLMDYYLMGERGDHVTRALRACEKQYRPTIIGYSSVASASEAIVRAGADTIIRKHVNDRGINPSLSAWLKAQEQ